MPPVRVATNPLLAVPETRDDVVSPVPLAVEKTYLLAVAAVFVLTAAFRFLALKNGFVNDHFIYITGGQQLLFGDWPTRDFLDPGLPLMYVASAAAQKLFGPTLLAEAILVSAAFALGAAVTLLVVRRLTGSLLLGIVAALFEVAVFPRTYSYPKIAVYAVVFWLYCEYIERPHWRRLRMMALGVAVAFLFRHDHGLFLGMGAMAAAVVAEPRTPGVAAVRVTTLAALVFVMLAPYAIYVQMHGGVLAYLESGIQISAREISREPHVWPTVLFGDPRPLESAFLYECYALPVGAALVLAARWRTHRDVRIVPIIVAAVFVDAAFLRDPLSTRLADGIVPAVVLGAWLMNGAFRAPWRAVSIPVACTCALVMGASVLAVGKTGDEVNRAGLLGRRDQVVGRFRERTVDLQSRFLDYQMPTPAARRLVPFFAYIDRCTSPTDRLLVGGFLPEAPFYAKRPFAGVEGLGGYFSSDAGGRRALQSLRESRVAFALLPSDASDELESRFASVAREIQAQFTPLTDVRVDSDLTIKILINRRLAARRIDAETGWPCAQ